MVNTNSLLNSTVLSPTERERQKTPQQKAEDGIYTLNHAVTCLTITDMFGLTLAANLVKEITGKMPKWAEHEAHGHGPEMEYSPIKWVRDRLGNKHKDDAYVADFHAKNPHAAGDHSGHGHAPTLHPRSTGKQVVNATWHNAKGWLLAEAVGDLGAVPFTVGLQRFAPGFMQGLRGMMEPVIGGVFKRNTHRAAVKWGYDHHKAADSEEVKNYAHELYEYEMHHMPQMAVWTVSSVGLNFAAMKLQHKLSPQTFEDITLPTFLAGKSIGAGMTAGLVLAVRGFTPGGAHKWDQTVGKKVILPITKTVGGLFGVKAEDVDAFQKNREAHDAKPATTVQSDTAEQAPLMTRPPERLVA